LKRSHGLGQCVAVASGQCVCRARNSVGVGCRHYCKEVLEHYRGVGEVASEAASPVLRCSIASGRRWRELAQDRAAALERNQAPQAITSRMWPRCPMGVTHAFWPLCAVSECIWAWCSNRSLPRLAASAAGSGRPGLNTAPVAESRHVSRARTLVGHLSSAGEGRSGSLNRHSTTVLCPSLPIVRLGTSALSCSAPRVHCCSCCVGSVAAGPLNRTEGSSVQLALHWAPTPVGWDRSSSRTLIALSCRLPRALQLGGSQLHADCSCSATYEDLTACMKDMFAAARDAAADASCIVRRWNARMVQSAVQWSLPVGKPSGLGLWSCRE
jgi:hypothetical protein